MDGDAEFDRHGASPCELSGHTYATHLLAVVHAHGFGVKEDRQAALKLLATLYKSGTSFAAALTTLDDDNIENLMERNHTELFALLSAIAEYDDGACIWDRLAPYEFGINTLLNHTRALLREYEGAPKNASAYPQFYTETFVTEDVILLEVKRTPKDLRDAVLNGPELADLRDALGARHSDVELKSGAKLFVRPCQYEAVVRAVRDMDLKPRHIIVAVDYEALVTGVIKGVGQQAGVKQKDILTINLPSLRVDVSEASSDTTSVLSAHSAIPQLAEIPSMPVQVPEVSNAMATEAADISSSMSESHAKRTKGAEVPVLIEISRTFIHVRLPSSLLSGSSSSRHAATC